MFLALALLNTTRGKEAETREPAPVETTKSEVIIDKQHDNVPNVVTKTAGQTMSPPLTLWQFIGRIIDAFNGAFNAPSLIEYTEPTWNRHSRLADRSTPPYIRPATRSLEVAIKSTQQILVKLLGSNSNYMKSLHCWSVWKTALLIVPLALCFGGSTVVQAGDKDPLSPGPIRPGNLDYRTELPQGYLEVYSATDKFNDGDALYLPHSSYAIFTIDGKLFKNVKNQRFPADEMPEVVALPVGTYAVIARSERDGIRPRPRCYQGRSADDR